MASTPICIFCTELVPVGVQATPVVGSRYEVRVYTRGEASPLVLKVVSLWEVVVPVATVPPEADLILSCHDSAAAVKAFSRIPT